MEKDILREWEEKVDDLEEKINLSFKVQRNWIRHFKEKQLGVGE